jgi:hypothetical protein
MTSRTFVLGLALTLAAPQGVLPADLEQTSRIIEIALSLPPESAVALKTKSNESLKGRLGAVSDDALTIRVPNGTTISSRTIPFNEITSLKRTGKPMSPAKAALITIGIVYAIGAVIGLAVGG